MQEKNKASITPLPDKQRKTQVESLTPQQMVHQVVIRQPVSKKSDTNIDSHIKVYCLLLLGVFSVLLFIGACISISVAPERAYLPSVGFLVSLKMLYNVLVKHLR